MKMTDSQMKKFFNSLLRDEHDYDDLSIAMAMLAALGAFDDRLGIEENQNFENKVSDR